MRRAFFRRGLLIICVSVLSWGCASKVVYDAGGGRSLITESLPAPTDQKMLEQLNNDTLREVKAQDESLGRHLIKLKPRLSIESGVLYVRFRCSRIRRRRSFRERIYDMNPEDHQAIDAYKKCVLRMLSNL